ncbi:MAG TPA: TIGR03067 domain-containing protein [Tepidisphaeraceae bacterium]|nr:TIGR03067 domain-containing protein [Tepidisphaeraceae bacterium]
MRLKLISVLLLLVVCVLRAEPPVIPDALAELQGRWRLTEIAFDGQHKKGITGVWLKIDGDQLLSEDQPDDVATIEIDASQTPKWFDLTDRENKVNIGIYKIEGNVMTIASADSGGARPTEFESVAGSKVFLSVYERETVNHP